MKFVILDRDGVINEDSDLFIKSPDEWTPIPGSIEAISKLSNNGYLVFIVTNQSGIGRGLFDEAMLTAIHQKMYSLVEELGGEITGVYYCPHLPADNCDCRKPKVGLLHAIESEFSIKINGAPFVGDSLSDIKAASSYHCQPILVKTGKGTHTLTDISPEEINNILVFNNLAEAASFILERNL